MRRLLLAASVAGLAGCETAKFDAPLDPAPMRPAQEIAFDAGEQAPLMSYRHHMARIAAGQRAAI